MNQSHLPLHLKYRPQNFNNMIGQEKATQHLKSSIEEKKIAFAYLFAGQHGSGKTTLARITAKAINCRSLKTVPCNICSNCINIHLGHSFDFYEIDAAKNTGVEKIREIMENIQFTPLMNEYKICIIDEAHMLSRNAFNSLLKTLESPPAKTVFILSTTALGKIPNTIISRCQTVYFQPIQDQDLAIAISKVVHNEKLKITNKGLGSLLDIIQGSFRDALNIIDIFSVKKQDITAHSLSNQYLMAPSFIVELLVDNILTLNFLKVLIIIDYIQCHYWNNEDIIRSMYKLLIYKYTENKRINKKKETLFFNTSTLRRLLKILVECRLNIKKDYSANLLLFVLENKDKRIVIEKTGKRRKAQLHIQREKIYSN